MADFAMHYVRTPDYRGEILALLAFHLRYGAKSIDELERRSCRFLMELSHAIGDLMRQEKKAFDANAMTGDS